MLFEKRKGEKLLCGTFPRVYSTCDKRLASVCFEPAKRASKEMIPHFFNLEISPSLWTSFRGCCVVLESSWIYPYLGYTAIGVRAWKWHRRNGSIFTGLGKMGEKSTSGRFFRGREWDFQGHSESHEVLSVSGKSGDVGRF